jgi:hypothetical protein
MITVLTDPGVGGTFLTWSIHFLAGHNNYYSAKLNATVELTNNPLTDINAHNFQPNQLNNIDQLDQMLTLIESTTAKTFCTMYFHNLKDCDRSFTGTTSQAITKILPKSEKIIYLSLDQKNSLYQNSYYRRHVSHQAQDTEHQKCIDEYFLDSKEKWQQLQLTNVWDYREFLALNILPFDIVKITDVSDLQFEHHYIDSFDLYHNTCSVVQTLFDYIKLSIDSERWHQWNKVCKSWQQLHTSRTQFVYYFDCIIDYIIKGKSFDLTRFNLDILQEAAIQHQLIYKHNLNLKTWQLEKFKNTNQLHCLLEDNIHPLRKI